MLFKRPLTLAAAIAIGVIVYFVLVAGAIRKLHNELRWGCTLQVSGPAGGGVRPSGPSTGIGEFEIVLIAVGSISSVFLVVCFGVSLYLRVHRKRAGYCSQCGTYLDGGMRCLSCGTRVQYRDRDEPRFPVVMRRRGVAS